MANNANITLTDGLTPITFLPNGVVSKSRGVYDAYYDEDNSTVSPRLRAQVTLSRQVYSTGNDKRTIFVRIPFEKADGSIGFTSGKLEVITPDDAPATDLPLMCAYIADAGSEASGTVIGDVILSGVQPS